MLPYHLPKQVMGAPRKNSPRIGTAPDEFFLVGSPAGNAAPDQRPRNLSF